MTKQIRVLFLAESRDIALGVLKCLQSRRYWVEVIGSEINSIFRLSSICKRFHQIDKSMFQAGSANFLQKINHIAEVSESDILVTDSISPAGLFAEQTNQIRLPVIPQPTAAIFGTLNNKWSFHGLCQRLNVPTPSTMLLETKKEIVSEQLEEKLGFPLVVKPVDKGGSEGVVIARSPEELRRQIIDNVEYDYSPLIVQQYAPGKDLGVNILAVNGEVICCSCQIFDGISWRFGEYPRALGYVSKLVSAVNYTGLAHFDYQYEEESRSLKLLECNPRCWASINASAECGLNFVEAAINIGLGLRNEQSTISTGASFGRPLSVLKAFATLRLGEPDWNAATFRGLWNFFKDPMPTIVTRFSGR